MANVYSVTKTIGGVEYIAQFAGLSVALDAVDNSYIDGSNNTSVKKMAQYLFDNVLVSPKVTVNDFNSMDDFNEVVDFCRRVMQGELKPVEEKQPTKKTSKE